MKHEPYCKTNIQCLVYHSDGICPGYKECDCKTAPKANITWRPETGEVKFHTEPKEKNCPDCQFEPGSHSFECPKYVEEEFEEKNEGWELRWQEISKCWDIASSVRPLIKEFFSTEIEKAKEGKKGENFRKK